MQTIEYKHNKTTELFIQPLENGKAEYYIELHDYLNLDCVREIVSYNCLQDIIRNPHDFLNDYRATYRFMES